jgi:hypothetical protein
MTNTASPNEKLAAIIAAAKAKKEAKEQASPSIVPSETPKPLTRPILPPPVTNDLITKVKESRSAQSIIASTLAKAKETKAKSQQAQESTKQVNSLLAKILADHKAKEQSTVSINYSQDSVALAKQLGVVDDEVPEISSRVDKHLITKDRLNEQQLKAVEYAVSGKSFCLIGGGGTGKTTTQKITIEEVDGAHLLNIIQDTNEHKYLLKGSPTIAIVSFTNKAVENIRVVVPERMKSNVMTAHKLVQYAPEYYTVEEIDEHGNSYEKEKMRFTPTFNASNLLPNIDLIIWEESSNISTDLAQKVWDALPPNPNRFEIFLGDLNQLPPVIGESLLANKMIELPVVGLEKVYRQSNDSPIKLLSYDLVEGKTLDNSQLLAYTKPDELDVIFLPKRLSGEEAIDGIGMALRNWVIKGKFNPETDIVLTPFRQGGHVNTNNLNLWLAQGHSEVNKTLVYEVINGWNKMYMSVGDIILANARQMVITDIQVNKNYSGVVPKPPSYTMDRWGKEHGKVEGHEESESLLDVVFSSFSKDVGDEEKKNSLSHIITARPLVGDIEDEYNKEVTLSTVNSFDYGYALTVHKSQGSEWRKVIMVLHHTQLVMAQREILYTGITRAREHLVLILDKENKNNPKAKNWFVEGVMNQALEGNTIAEKIVNFRKEVERKEKVAKLEAELLAAKIKREELKNEQKHSNI